MTQITKVRGSSTYEDIAAYSRAIVYNDLIEVSGTTASDGPKVSFGGDMYGQTRDIFERIQKILEDNGSGIDHIIRIRYYVTDITKWKEVAEVAKEFLDKSRPAATLVEVSNLVDPDMLIEIEVSAVKVK